MSDIKDIGDGIFQQMRLYIVCLIIALLTTHVNYSSGEDNLQFQQRVALMRRGDEIHRNDLVAFQLAVQFTSILFYSPGVFVLVNEVFAEESMQRFEPGYFGFTAVHGLMVFVSCWLFTFFYGNRILPIKRTKLDRSRGNTGQVVDQKKPMPPRRRKNTRKIKQKQKQQQQAEEKKYDIFLDPEFTKGYQKELNQFEATARMVSHITVWCMGYFIAPITVNCLRRGPLVVYLITVMTIALCWSCITMVCHCIARDFVMKHSHIYAIIAPANWKSHAAFLVAILSAGTGHINGQVDNDTSQLGISVDHTSKAAAVAAYLFSYLALSRVFAEVYRRMSTWILIRVTYWTNVLYRMFLIARDIGDGTNALVIATSQQTQPTGAGGK